MPSKELTLRTQAMPADTNPAGDIFGGWVMSQMDIAAGIRGSELTLGRVVTAGVGKLNFERPIRVGDTICVYTEAERIGRSSITLHVDCMVKRQFSGQRERAVVAEFTMVALDEHGKPRAHSLREDQT
ncbi:acyl-CoA thioesterase [Leisingera methylohalidivorans]|nr:acyl-CoA thioesterase [Leisingera methylohalidivorans]